MTLTFSSPIPASREELWAFHRSAEALKELTPPPTSVRLLSDGTVRDGALHVIESRVFGIAVGRWEARISEVGPDGFTDTAERCPLRSWRHVHRFLERGAESELVDEVTFEPGWAAPLVRFLFAYRHRATRRRFSRDVRP